jgi:alpha-beta hydrolase superfamily lysophospholipase
MVTSAAAASALPGPIDPSASFRFPSKDGRELYGELYEHSSPRGAALVLHGYAEHCGRYREVAHVLHQAGFATLAFDMRGHGRAAGARGHALRFEEFLGDVEAALGELDRRLGRELPLALVCHSHGGLVGLRLLADPWRCPKRVRCAVISSPFLRLRMKVSPVKRVGARWVGFLLPSLSLPNEIPIDKLTHDAGKLAERRVDTLCHDVAGARWFNEALAAQAWVSEFAHRVAVPTLWLIGGEDAIADPSASRAVAERVGGPARIHVLEGQYHEVFNESERGATFALMREFLEENFPK